MFKQVLREGTPPPPPYYLCYHLFTELYIDVCYIIQITINTNYIALSVRTIYIYTHKNYHSSYIISTEYRGIHFRLKLIVLHVCYFHNGPEVEKIKRCEQLSNKINLVLAEKKCKIEL